MSNRTIALYGGSFDPPHVAHQLVACYVLATQPVDELWFVPTYTHPFGKQLAPYNDRVEMCKRVAAMFASKPRVRVSLAEQQLANRPGFVASRTLDLVSYLRARNPAAAFRLVIGADILAETDKWYRWDELMKRAPAIVVGRSGVAPAKRATGVAMPAISGTEIRRRLGQGRDVAGLLPTSVLGYIRSRKLYR